MKRYLWLILFLFVVFGCSQKESNVEKFVEDGIEIVVNRAEPYQVPETPHPSKLEEESVIDLEDEAVTQTGLYRLDAFAVDDDKNIYILAFRSEKNHIYKFSPEGKFVTSFGQDGQGPGELARPYAIILTNKKELMVTDPENTKLVFFSKEGSLLREFDLKRNISFMYPLSNGNFVVFGRMRPDPEQRNLKYPLELCDENVEPIKTLDEYLMENFLITKRIRGTQPGFSLAVGGERIFIGNEARDYEIWIFNQDGELVRKIRNAYKPLPVSQEIKDKALSRYSEQMRQMVFFPDTLPPFRSMTADEVGTLFILTFEPGENENENQIDVFNPEGIYISRLSADVFVSVDTPLNMVAQNGRFYYIRETNTGFKQLVVERIVYE